MIVQGEKIGAMKRKDRAVGHVQGVRDVCDIRSKGECENTMLSETGWDFIKGS